MNRVSTWLAMVLPVVVLALGTLGVATFEPERAKGAERELANAGRVMNGRRLNKSVVEAMEADLRQHRPKVLIVGNSYANTNIDPKLVAEALGLPRKKVRVLSVPNSVGTHWYAILKNRVYANGHHPQLIIVVTPLQSMLLSEPYSESSYTNLYVQMGADEPLLYQRVPRSSLLARQLRQRRGAVRDSVLAGIRDAAIGLVYPSDTLQRDNEAALDRVFHDSNVDMSRYEQALPVVDTRDGRGETGPGAVPHPSESMLGPIGELATANGSRLLWVRSPMAPRTPEDELDAVPEGWEDATFEVIDESGHLLADLSALPMQDALFHNPGHMSDEGARAFTRALIRVMSDHAIYGAGRPPVAWRPPKPEVRVEPEAPVDLDPSGLAELLDGVWVAPGGTLTVSSPEGWGAGRPTWDLQLVAEQMGQGAFPGVRYDGRPLQGTVRPGDGDNRRIFLERPMPPPSGPWTLEVINPPDAAPLLVQGLQLGREAATRQVIGRVENHLPATYELFGQLDLRRGQMTVAQPTTSYASPPPDISADRELVPNRKRPNIATIKAPGLDRISDARTLKITPLGVRCSPVRVLEDGQPLPRTHESCNLKTRGVPGRVCHGPDKRVLFGSSDASPVTEHRYELALDPERDCMGGRWLYPGDRMTLTVGPEILARFREGARSLTLTGASASPEDTVVPFVLQVDGELVLRDVLPLGGTLPVETHYVLERPLRPSDRNVELIVENPGKDYVLLTGGLLRAGKRGG